MEKPKNHQDILSVLLIFICLHLLISTTSGAQYYKSNLLFNRTCKNRDDCSFSHSYLNCIGEKCVCYDHAYFDKEDEYCRIKIPSECVIKRGPENVQPCIRDAYCAFPKDNRGHELKTSVNGICRCITGLPPKSDGLCSAGLSNTFHYKFSYFAFILSLLVVGRVLGCSS